MRNISIKMEEIWTDTQSWLTKISKIFWHWVSTLRKHSSFSIQGIWASCTPTSADSRSISTLLPLKPYLDSNLLIIAEKLHILLFRQLLASQALSLISSATRTFLVWFPVELIRTLTSEWPEMFVPSWKLPSQQAFTTSFSLLSKDSMSRCQDRYLSQEFSWPTSLKRSKPR